MKAMRMRFKKLNPEAIAPTYAHMGDAGMDLYAIEGCVLKPGETCMVGTGVSIALPNGYVGLIHPRSGLAAKHGLTVLNAPGTVDAGYRGEIKVLLHNTSSTEFTVNPYDRIAQLIVQEVMQCILEEVNEFEETARGMAGFGSTGF